MANMKDTTNMANASRREREKKLHGPDQTGQIKRLVVEARSWDGRVETWDESWRTSTANTIRHAAKEAAERFGQANVREIRLHHAP